MMDETQNFMVAWLNLQKYYSDFDVSCNIESLQKVVSRVVVFNDLNECIDYVTDMSDANVILILSGNHLLRIIAMIKNIANLHSIYIYDKNQRYSSSNVFEYTKVKGIFDSVEIIRNLLHDQLFQLKARALPPFSIISLTSTPNVGQLDQSYMYTKLLIETILQTESQNNERERFVHYLLEKNNFSPFRQEKIKRFQENYSKSTPIYWYVMEPLFQETLNNALRLQDTISIIRMAFFLRDLYHQMQANFELNPKDKPFKVYRGQRLCQGDFERLKSNVGGILSFNSFLSTSINKEISKRFMGDESANDGFIGVLFEMEINPLISSTPYFDISKTDLSSEEQEILFGMQTIFRIDKIFINCDKLWQINLIITNDEQSELTPLTNFIRDRLSSVNGWCRMMVLLTEFGKFNEAIEVSEVISMNLNVDEEPELEYVLQSNNTLLNLIKCSSDKKDQRMLSYWQMILTNLQQNFPPEHIMFGLAYLYIGTAHYLMRDYKLSLQYYQTSLEIFEKSCLEELMYKIYILYYLIGDAHAAMQEFSSALSHYQKALKSMERSVQCNHPNVSLLYIKIALLYQTTNKPMEALGFMRKALEIQQTSLAADHLYLGLSYNTIGLLHQTMGQYPESLLYLQKALEIFEIHFSSDSLDKSGWYMQIAGALILTGDYMKAKYYCEKALETNEKFLSNAHSVKPTIYSYLGIIHETIGEQDVSLSYFRKVLDFEEIVSVHNPVILAITYSKIGQMHYSMRCFPQALEFYEKAATIYQTSGVSQSENLAISYAHMSSIHQNMGDFVKAELYLEKSRELQRENFSLDRQASLHTEANAFFFELSKHGFSNSVPTLTIASKIFTRFSGADDPPASNTFFNGAFTPEQLYHGASAISCMQQIEENSNMPTTYQTINSSSDIFSDLPNTFQHLRKMFETQPGTELSNKNGIIDIFCSMQEAITSAEEFSSILSNDKNSASDVSNGQKSIDDRLVTMITHIEKVFEGSSCVASYRMIMLPQMYQRLADLFYENGCPDKALSYLWKIVDMLHEVSPDHPLLIKARNHIQIIMNKINHFK